jgi:hypothetical protein
MGSDRARVTYDPKQQYRSVVMQQGRVTLEADWNEAGQITNEEIRKEALDFVGPCGTPDDGYKVVLTSASPTNLPFDFYIRSGTMYVGGIRAYLYDPVQYSNQPDWRDYGPEDPDWVDPASFTASPSISPINEFIYLLLREQEVSAVEDPDLKDVALGGPDTAQRTRLLQRFVRIASQGTDCVSGLAAAQAKWQSEGLFFDPDTMRLCPWSRLQVGFSKQTQPPDPCQPQAQGGYLDPDNQLIRVQISGIDQASGNPKFLWGFDDASFLYRINVDPHNPQNLVFQQVPVDANHQPISGQAVEVLRTTADLPNGGDVAATSGFVFTLEQNYNPDSQSVAIPTGISLPPDYTNSNQSPPNQLFLRVWQQEVAFTPGQQNQLGNTGVLVTLSTPNNQPFHLSDYWLFAVRPATPQTVYPERYQNESQRPDGPRLWACPLGVIAWSEEVGTLVSDCRNQLCNLVDLCKRQQGCCTITVKPQDLDSNTTLQAIVNQASRPTMLVQAANPGAPGNNISVAISNVQLNATPPTFDLTVTETDIHLGLTVNGSNDGIEVIIGDEEGGPNDGLAHILVGSVNPQLVPLDNQKVTFTGGQSNANALANFMDSSNQNVVFTLQARNPGTDGNLTTATISNLSGSPPTFALTVTWQKTLSGLNMATLFPSIQSGMGYEIVVTPPTTVAPSFPAEGVTELTGGAEADPNTQTNATTAQASIFGNPVKICLRPGSYPLMHPLVLGPEQSNITIEACGSATISAVLETGSKEFVQGMVHLNGVNNLTLRGLIFVMPQVVLFQTGNSLAGLSMNALQSVGETGIFSLNSSLGLAVSGCQGLTVEDCTFRFPAAQLDELLFGAGILAGADCADIRLNRNSFQGPATISAIGPQTIGTTLSLVFTAGYVQADSLQGLSLGGGDSVVNGGTLVPSTLDNLTVCNNSFENLTFPVFIATALGIAKFEANIVRSSLSGFTIVPLIASVAGANQFKQNDFRAQLLTNPTAQRFLSIAVAYPRPASFVPRRKIILTTAPMSPITAPSGQPGLRSFLNVFTVTKRVPPVASAAAARPATATPTAAAVPGVPASGSAPSAPADPAARAASVAGLQNLRPLALCEAQFFHSVAAGDINIAVVGTTFAQSLNFSVDFSNNDINAVLPGVGSLWALSILDAADLIKAAGGSPGPNTDTTFGMLTLTSNKLRNSWPGDQSFTASVMVDYCAATGNVILNQRGERGASLAIVVLDTSTPPVNIAWAAVTGNVLFGRVLLPPRTAAALPDWQTYNFAR